MSENVVFIVTSGEYSDYRVEAAFSERGLAEQFCQTVREREKADILELVLNDRTNEVWRKVWRAYVREDGSVQNNNWDPHLPCLLPLRYAKVETALLHPSGVMFASTSTVSPEHALKVATEARQAWLRENPPKLQEKK